MNLSRLAASASTRQTTTKFVFSDKICVLTSQDEESEKIIGEWMHSRGIRDRMVLATK